MRPDPMMPIFGLPWAKAAAPISTAVPPTRTRRLLHAGMTNSSRCIVARANYHREAGSERTVKMSHDPALDAHEHAEHAEHAAHAQDPFISRVAITVSVLAVMAAAA